MRAKEYVDNVSRKILVENGKITFNSYLRFSAAISLSSAVVILVFSGVAYLVSLFSGKTNPFLAMWFIGAEMVLSVVSFFVLFILAINYLRKCIAPIQEQRFYSEEVISNLKKSGRLFIIIALGTSFIRIVGVFMIKNLTNRLAYGGNLGGQIGVTNLMQTTDSSVWSYLGAILSAIGGTNFFLLIIGLFLLVFSSVFKEGQLLKQENDLTI